MKIAYLGDGVYAEFDGDYIVLKANDPNNPSDTIYIDKPVWKKLSDFVANIETFAHEEN